jgi:excisionase family DNA binding protein
VSDRDAYTAAEVAYRLGVRVVTVQRWLQRGEIAGTKIGGMWFVPVGALQARLRGYDDGGARSQRGEPVPADPGPTLGGDRDDAGRTPPIEVRRVDSPV